MSVVVDDGSCTGNRDLAIPSAEDGRREPTHVVEAAAAVTSCWPDAEVGRDLRGEIVLERDCAVNEYASSLARFPG